MKIFTLLGLLIASATFSNWVFAASEDDPEQAIETSFNPSVQMPLDLYRSLRAKFMKLAEPASAEGQLVSGELLAQLQTEIRAHESEIQRAASAQQALQREIAARSL